MRNLLALCALLLLVFAGVGWYLDWYHVRSSPAAEGHQNVNIDINSSKILADVNKGIQKLEEKAQASRDNRTADGGAPAQMGPPAPSATSAATAPTPNR